MTMLCSVLIPSRVRPERLQKTIASVRDSSYADKVEILVRFDDDDAASLAIRAELEDGGVSVIVGPRGQGYLTLASYYEELAAAARGAWIWIMNDDAHVAAYDGSWPPRGRAKGWDHQLELIPTSGYIVQPEMYQLGGSGYRNCEGSAFPIVPQSSWCTFGEPLLRDPIDTWLDVILHQQGGWTTRFLRGVAVVHERDPEDVLEQHRRIL